MDFAVTVFNNNLLLQIMQLSPDAKMLFSSKQGLDQNLRQQDLRDAF